MTAQATHAAQVTPATAAAQATPEASTNEVLLVGRVSGVPEAREMPSGDEVVQFRVVIRRPPAKKPARRAAIGPSGEGGGSGSAGTSSVTRTQVDTIDVACWSASSRRAARRFTDGDVVEVQGALRRRFYRAGPATVSRYEVEAATVRRHT
ncbi:single-stranded DNA-binding protein [Lapillicoccus sp.]|uniref:single-stranded DNA-binding protein n=1 Tax=Lapillicoccus sp. TaxID=1909287 RepID=UPI0025E5B0D1|nr:single-stranded DNA-binding protein [Lapillicoccus sp.]